MEWTREKPTKPGQYWLCSGSDKYVVEVGKYRGAELRHYICGADEPYEFPNDAMWYGPIEPPPLHASSLESVDEKQELDWTAATRHALVLKAQYVALLGKSGVNQTIALSAINLALKRFNDGERTDELYDELVNLR